MDSCLLHVHAVQQNRFTLAGRKLKVAQPCPTSDHCSAHSSTVTFLHSVVLLCPGSRSIVSHRCSLVFAKYSVISLLKASSLHSSFSQAFCPTNSSCTSSPERSLSLSLFSILQDHCSLVGLLPPHCYAQVTSRKKAGALLGLTSFVALLSGGHRTVLQDPTTENSNFIYFVWFLWLFVMEGLMQWSYSIMARSWNLSFVFSFSVSVVRFIYNSTLFLNVLQSVIFGILFI